MSLVDAIETFRADLSARLAKPANVELRAVHVAKGGWIVVLRLPDERLLTRTLFVKERQRFDAAQAAENLLAYLRQLQLVPPADSAPAPGEDRRGSR